MLRKFFHYLYLLYASLVFFVLMLLVFLGTLIAFLFPEPISGNVILKICHYWAVVWYFMVGLRFQAIYEGKVDRRKSYIFVLNHQSYLDIPATVYAIHQPVRILAKMEMSKIPIFGTIYRKATVMVDRSSTAARSKSVAQMQKVLRRYGLSVLIYPEGTFNETGRPLKSFYNGAFRLAIETQTDILPVILPDTLARMPHPAALNPGRCRVVYLPEISVQGLTLSDTEMLKQRTHDLMERAICSYQAS